MISRLRLMTLVLASAGVALAGCPGDDSGGDDAASTTGSGGPTTSGEPTTTTAATGDGTEGPGTTDPTNPTGADSTTDPTATATDTGTPATGTDSGGSDSGGASFDCMAGCEAIDACDVYDLVDYNDIPGCVTTCEDSIATFGGQGCGEEYVALAECILGLDCKGVAAYLESPGAVPQCQAETVALGMCAG